MPTTPRHAACHAMRMATIQRRLKAHTTPKSPSPAGVPAPDPWENVTGEAFPDEQSAKRRVQELEATPDGRRFEYQVNP